VPRGAGTDEEILAFFYTNLALAWAVQAVASAIAAAWGRSLLHGLGAAFVAGCVMSTSILAVNAWHGGGSDPSFLLSVFVIVVNIGGPVAFVISLAASRLARRVRHARTQPATAMSAVSRA
jgi:hypothetical protein